MIAASRQRHLTVDSGVDSLKARMAAAADSVSVIRPKRFLQIGLNYFSRTQLRQDATESSVVIHMQEAVIASAWDKVLTRQDDGAYKVSYYGNIASEKIIDSEEIVDAVFTQTSLCFIVKGKIKIVDLNCGADVVQMNSTHVWRRISFLENIGIYALTDNGQLHMIQENIPRWIPLVVRISQLSCGISHGIVLADNGTLYTWGNGSRGQLGHGNVDDQPKPKLVDLLCGVTIKSVAAGGWHSMALADTGDVYVWGWNESGQLGFPTKSAKERVHISNDENVQIGMLTSPKLLELEKYVKEDSFISIHSISCGSRHSVAITDNGKAISWGWGKYGQLGHKCCIFTNMNTSKETCSKQLKLNSGESDLCSHKCKVEVHLPGQVEYFAHGRFQANDVHCGRWTTYFSYSDYIS